MRTTFDSIVAALLAAGQGFSITALIGVLIQRPRGVEPNLGHVPTGTT
jgi:hypothetical protein